MKKQEYKLRLEQVEKQRDIAHEILQERLRQDEKWGGPEHDDEHTRNDWLNFIAERANDFRGSGNQYRQTLIKIAELSWAEIESFDRT